MIDAAGLMVVGDRAGAVGDAIGAKATLVTGVGVVIVSLGKGS